MNTRKGDPMGNDEGLLSGLPKTRPGVQTRRRTEAREAAQAEAASQAGTAGDGTASSPPGPEASNPSLTGAVGDLARVSAEAAAGTAAAGIRLAGRAAGGLGKALARR